MKAGRREWIALSVLALPTMLVTMDLSVLFLALPKLTRELRPTSSELLWITDIYGFLIAASLITMGTLADRIGRRRLLLIGAAAFGCASVVAAFSTSAWMLIGARAVLGVSGATLAPSSLALIRNLFADPRQRQFAIGIWVSCFAAGAAIGPVLGGVLLNYFWWGSVFLMNVPVMAVLLLAGPRLLPESRDPSPGRIDLLSVALSLASVLGVIFAVTQSSEHGVHPSSAIVFAVGLLIGVVFIRRQQRLSYPLIDLRLFGSARFAAACAAMLVSVFVIAGTDLFTAQYLQLVRGFSPFIAGLWLLPAVIALIVGSMSAPRIAGLAGVGAVVAGGLLVATVGLVLLAQLSPGSSLALLVTGATLVGLGAGPVGTLGSDLIVATAAPERAGAASAISETATEFGGALGIALLGAIGTAVYRDRLDAVAHRLPAGALRGSRDSLGAAVEAAAHVPTALRGVLLHGARAGFTDGFAAAALVAAVIGAVTALFAVVKLRGAEPLG